VEDVPRSQVERQVVVMSRLIEDLDPGWVWAFVVVVLIISWGLLAVSIILDVERAGAVRF